MFTLRVSSGASEKSVLVVSVPVNDGVILQKRFPDGRKLNPLSSPGASQVLRVRARANGENDGVFGLSYRVHGSMSNPTLTVNPLSAIAPGILRRILGAIDGTTSRGGVRDPETGATVTRRPAR